MNKIYANQKNKRLANFFYTAGLFTLVLAFALSMSGGSVQAARLNADSPGLGEAGSFSVLGEVLITNSPTSVIGGDVGLSPATGAGIGLNDAEVGGTIYSVDAFAPVAANATVNPGLLTNAINAMIGTYTALDQPCTTTYAGVQDLTIVSPLSAGVYCADAFLLTGNLTLSGAGVWIFKSSATLTTSAGSSVTGGDPCNVWWRLVSAADLGTNSSMIGNILAGTSINMQNGASLNGRALAQASVTLDANTITGPSCASAASSGEPAPTPGPTAITSASVETVLAATGADQTGASNQVTLIGLGILGLGLVAVGFVLRRKQRKNE